jgi:hypothetical protein
MKPQCFDAKQNLIDALKSSARKSVTRISSLPCFNILFQFWYHSPKYIWAKTIKFPLRSRLEMSPYFTNTGIFTNNCNICYHSKIMPATIYLEEVRIFSIHKIFSPLGVWKRHNITLLMGFSYWYYFPMTAWIRSGNFLDLI